MGGLQVGAGAAKRTQRELIRLQGARYDRGLGESDASERIHATAVPTSENASPTHSAAMTALASVSLPSWGV